MTENVNKNAPIAVTGSPNTITTIAFDVLVDAINTPLDGALVEIHTKVVKPHGVESLVILGQVVQAQTTNRWHESPALAGVIKVRGCIPHLTGISDVTRGTISILGTYKFNNGAWEKTTLAVPPGTGIQIQKVTMPTVEGLLQTERRPGESHGHYAFVGQFWGTEGVYAPVNVRHFGDFKDGGLGEAWMGGIFGPSGSGKSVMAAKLIAAYAHNPKMGILLVDPQSEFSENKMMKPGLLDMDFHALLRNITKGKFNPARDVLRIDQIAWDSGALMIEVLRQKRFFQTIGISRDKMKEARELLEQELTDLKKKLNGGWRRKWADINSDPKDAARFQNAIISAMGSAYAASARVDQVQKFTDNWVNEAARLESAWDRAVELFLPSSEKTEVEEVLVSALERGAIKLLDLDPVKVEMNDEFRNFILDALLSKLRAIVNRNYKGRENPTNCLVVFDEAHLFCPQSSTDEEDSPTSDLANNLEKTVRMLRKMRTGFLFITQSISKIRTDIFRNLMFTFYGAGLIANDLKRLEDKDGAEARTAYQNLPNPKQSGKYTFLVTGGSVCLGTSARPMIIEAVGGSDDFMRSNPHLFQ